MSQRVARLLLLAALVALFGPPVLRREVVFAHDNSIEVGLSPSADDGYVSNRKFADQSSVYVPEIHHHLNGLHEGWISTWNPHVECGRPTTQVAGFGKAFVVTHLLSFFTDDALVMASWQAILAVALTALFAFLLCQALGLRPEACLVGALGLALGVFHVYWLSFPLFLWTVCWSLAILWLIARDERGEKRWSTLFGLAFCVHALLLSGYPQLIVWHAYLITGFVLWRVLQAVRRGASASATLGRVACWGAGAVLGFVSVLPVYADLALAAGRSARLSADTSFFLEVLPEIHGWRDLARFWLLRFDAFWFGNPIEPDYPLRFNGLSMTPLYALLVATTLRPRILRRLWPAQLFVAATLVLTLWPAAYAFGVEHLGLHVSRTNPLAAAIIPGSILAAWAADALLREERSLGPLLIVLFVALLAGVCLASLATPFAPTFVAAGCALLAGFLWFSWSRRPLVLLVLLALTCLHYSTRLPLTRPPATVARTSPLVELVRRETAGGSQRFAWLAGGFGLTLPPNQEAFLGLRSIHSYNSLSSRAYQDWVLRLSPAGTQTYGRHFHQISSEAKLAGHELGFSGIGLVISGVRLASEALREIASNPNGGGIYRTREAPRLEAQVVRFRVSGEGEERRAIIEGSLASASEEGARRVLDQDDRLHFELPPTEETSLLFLSQQYHPQWSAAAGAEPLETLPVNDFYQGVLVPAGTTSVQLRFRPWVRWAWVPQALYALSAIVGVLGYFLRRNR